jgi:hypothetical protein
MPDYCRNGNNRNGRRAWKNISYAPVGFPRQRIGHAD